MAPSVTVSLRPFEGLTPGPSPWYKNPKMARNDKIIRFDLVDEVIRRLIEAFIIQAFYGLFTWLMRSVIIPRSLLAYALTSLCFLPGTAVFIWVYERYFLEKIGKNSVVWRMTVIPLVVSVMSGAFLLTKILGGNVPQDYFVLSNPKVRLQITRYCTNGQSDYDPSGGSLLITFRRNRSSEFDPGVVELPFEAGVILGAGASSFDLSTYTKVHVEYELVGDDEEQTPPIIGLGIKDVGGNEMKYLPHEGGLVLDVPLTLFSEVCLNKVNAIILFTRQLEPGQEIVVRLKELRCE